MTDLTFLQGKCVSFERVGSRVTCDPAPTDTDLDVLVLATLDQWRDHLSPLLEAQRFEKGGSDCRDAGSYMAEVPLAFQSFTFGELNLIVTLDPEFYRRFLAATSVAKSLNLLKKQDRIDLFQAVLYGNSVVPPSPPLALPLAPPLPSVGPYWATFDRRGPGCVEALNESDAKAEAEKKTGEAPVSCEKLPYPAEPRLNHYVDARVGVCPSFCYNPNLCKGRGSCPNGPACME